jgi:hypothetical protein
VRVVPEASVRTNARLEIHARCKAELTFHFMVQVQLHGKAAAALALERQERARAELIEPRLFI